MCPHGAGSAGGGRRERCEGATAALWVVVVTSIDSVVLRRAEARLLESTRKPSWALAREQYFTAALASLSISNHSNCAFSKHSFFQITNVRVACVLNSASPHRPWPTSRSSRPRHRIAMGQSPIWDSARYRVRWACLVKLWANAWFRSPTPSLASRVLLKIEPPFLLCKILALLFYASNVMLHLGNIWVCGDFTKVEKSLGDFTVFSTCPGILVRRSADHPCRTQQHGNY